MRVLVAYLWARRTLIVRLLGAGLLFLLTVVLARSMSSAAAGHLFWFQGVSALMTVILSQGLPIHVLRSSSVAGSAAQRREVVRRGRMRCVSGTAILLGLFLVVSSVLDLGFMPRGAPEWLMGAAILVGGIQCDLRIVGEGLKGAGPVGQGLAVQFVVGPLLSLLLVSIYRTISDVDLAAGVLFVVLGYGAASAVAWMLWLRVVGGAREQAAARSSVLVGAGWLWLIALSETALEAMPLLIAGILLEPTELAQVGASLRIAGVASLALSGVAATHAPRFAQAVARRAGSEQRELLRDSQKEALIAFAPALLVCLLFPGRVLAMFGGEFAGGKLVLLIVILGQLINVGTGAVGVLAQMARLDRLVALVTAGGVIGSCAAMLFAGRAAGATGIAAVYSAAIGSRNLWLYVRVMKAARASAEPARSTQTPERSQVMLSTTKEGAP